MPERPNSAPVVLITGGGRARIGNGIARDLASRGYAVALHYFRSQTSAKQTQRLLEQSGGTCELFQADLTNEQEVEHLFAQVQQKLGRLDALVMTASEWSARPLEEITAQELQQQWAINTLASFLCGRAAGLQMAQQSTGGSIILFGDAAIDQPYREHAAYFLSKGSLPTLTRVLAVELAERNPRVRVNCIQPGPILFPPDASEEEREALRQSTLVKQADCPDMVQLTVRFLIENQFLTGACLPLDGGRSLQMAHEIPRHQHDPQ